jgi:hypothetical protein
VTAPDQQASVQRIQTGHRCFRWRSALPAAAGLKVRVQSGEWPFAGGRLLLEETVLDFSQRASKHLTFSVRAWMRRPSSSR